MANALMDAVTQQIVQGMDPMNGVMRQFVSDQAQAKQAELLRMKADNVGYIAELLNKEKAKDHPNQTVVGAFERLLGLASAS